jgi:hypothetical protein
MERISRSPVAG